MTTFQIKIFAVATMVIDHIGLFLFPHLLILRIIGRLSFPLFAWLIANGAHHSKNKLSYLKRLFLFGVISQVPYSILFSIIDPGKFHLNIFFTLSFGLGMILLFNKYKNFFQKFMIFLLIGSISTFFQFEYGAFGLISIYCYYIFFKTIKKLFLSQIIIMGIFFIPQLFQQTFNISEGIIYLPSFLLIQPFSLLSLLFIKHYNQKEGLKVRGFFYSLYPLHLIFILILKKYFG